jgi:HEAT repeat protein
MSVTREDVLRVVQLIEPNVEAAVRLGPEALPHLRALLADEDVSVATRAASVAMKINDPATVRVAGAASRSIHPEVRLAVAAELWRLGDFNVRTPLSRLLVDADPDVRRRAIVSVGRLATVAAVPRGIGDAVEAMAVRDPLPANRAIAAPISDRLGDRPITAREVRAALSAHATPEEVAQALGRDVEEQLAAIARGANVTLAERAVAALVHVAPRRALAVVGDLADDRRARVRAAAATAAARVPGGREIVGPLLEDDDARVRAAALVAAARLRLPRLRETAGVLAEEDPDERVRQLAAEYLRGPEIQRQEVRRR